MHLEEVFRCGLAGTCIFSYTDEWFTGGHPITDWAFGLVRARPHARSPPSTGWPRSTAATRSRRWRATPRSRWWSAPTTASKTLDGCLRSLRSSTIPTTRSSSSTTAPRTRPRRSRRATPHPLPPPAQQGPVGGAQRRHGPGHRRDHRLHRRRLLRRRGLALLPGREAARVRRLGRRRAEPAADERRPGGGLRLGEPGHAGPHPDRRQRRGARPRLQHGVLGRPPARHRRLRSRVPRGRRRRGRVLAAAGGGRAHRLQPGGDGLAPPPQHRAGVPQAAARLRQGRGAPEAQAPREVPRLPRRPVVGGAHLHAGRASG